MRKTLLCGFLLVMAGTLALIIYLFMHMTPADRVEAVEQEEKKITFSWAGDNHFSLDVQEGLTRYEKNHPGIVFSLSHATDKGYWDQLYLAAADHELPDMMLLDYAHLPVFVEKRQLAPLDRFEEDGLLNLNGIDAKMLDYGRIGGHRYGIPVGIKAPALLYNESITAQAGVVIKDRMTLSEFQAICRRIYDSTKYKTMLPEEQSFNLLDYLLRAKGKYIYENGAIGFDGPEDTLPFFALYESAARDRWAFDRDTFGQEGTDDISESPLISGNGPSNMSWCGFYQSNDLLSGQIGAKTGVELGITTWPTDDFERSIYAMPSGFYTISAYSDKRTECAAVINAFSHERQYLNKMLSGKGLSVESVFAGYQGTLNDPTARKEIDYLKNVVLPARGMALRRLPPESEEINALLVQLEDGILKGSMTASEAADQFYKETSSFS